jgi:putative inorganic carbon (HCO3(-)) transporter
MGAVASSNQNDSGNVIAAVALDSVSAQRPESRRKPLLGAYISLLLFMVIYCARPEDWIPGLSHIPLAKIAVILAILASLFSLRHIRGRLPRENLLLFFLIAQLFAASLMSPVWQGGALHVTLDFAKVLIIVLIITVAAGSLNRLRILIFTQAICVSAIAAVTIWKGRLILGRLEGVLGGNYADPNDLALAINISLPLCLALLFVSKRWPSRIFWSTSILVMIYAVFRTGSRGGFVSLVAVAAICVWEFAICGRRRYLLVLAALAPVILWQFSGGMLVGRLKGTFNVSDDTAAAYASAEQRQQLFWRSIEVTKEHPLFGVGPDNFDQISGAWHVTHNAFTQMSSEGGIPALVLYVLILWSGFKNTRATIRLVRGQTESGVFARALFASLSGYAVGSLFLSVGYQFFPYILVAYTTVLFSNARKSTLQFRKLTQLNLAIAEETSRKALPAN